MIDFVNIVNKVKCNMTIPRSAAMITMSGLDNVNAAMRCAFPGIIICILLITSDHVDTANAVDTM